MLSDQVLFFNTHCKFVVASSMKLMSVDVASIRDTTTPYFQFAVTHCKVIQQCTQFSVYELKNTVYFDSECVVLYIKWCEELP